MKALTCYQPYASLIAVGAKTVETRPRGTDWRGPLLIHAAATIPSEVRLRVLNERMRGHFHTSYGGNVAVLNALYHHRFEEGGYIGEDARTLPLGAVVAVATLADVVPMVDVIGAEHQQGGYIEVGPSYLGLWQPGAPVLHRIDDQRPLGDFRPGRFGWLWEGVRPLPEPVPWRGQQAAPWSAPPELVAQVEAQLR